MKFNIKILRGNYALRENIGKVKLKWFILGKVLALPLAH